jgi:hypothetical protein
MVMALSCSAKKLVRSCRWTGIWHLNLNLNNLKAALMIQESEDQPFLTCQTLFMIEKARGFHHSKTSGIPLLDKSYVLVQSAVVSGKACHPIVN